MKSKYDEAFLVRYLSSHANIDSYYLSCLTGAGSEVVHFRDGDGMSWSLIEDDDDLFSATVEYLKSKAVPTFYEVNQLKTFAAVPVP